MRYPLPKVQYDGKAETAFNIKLNNHKKSITNPKSIPADLNFRKPGQLFNLNAKFTLINNCVIFPQQIKTP